MSAPIINVLKSIIGVIFGSANHLTVINVKYFHQLSLEITGNLRLVVSKVCHHLTQADAETPPPPPPLLFVDLFAALPNKPRSEPRFVRVPTNTRAAKHVLYPLLRMLHRFPRIPTCFLSFTWPCSSALFDFYVAARSLRSSNIFSLKCFSCVTWNCPRAAPSLPPKISPPLAVFIWPFIGNNANMRLAFIFGVFTSLLQLLSVYHLVK